MVKVRVKLTNRCQLRCKFCYNATATGEMSKETLYGTLPYIEQNASCVLLHGGEPLLYDNDTIIDYLSRISCDISAVTNLAYKLTDKRHQIFSMMRFENKCRIETSYDPVSRFTPASLRLWESNIKSLLSYMDDIEVSVTITKYVLDIVPAKLFDYLQGLGIHTINLERYITAGFCQAEVAPDPKLTCAWFDAAYQEYCRRKDELWIRVFQEIEDSLEGKIYGCRGRVCHTHERTIDVDGKLYTCPVNPFPANAIPIMITAPKCYKCKYFAYCKGDCPKLSADYCFLKVYERADVERKKNSK